MGIRFYCPKGHKLNVKAFLAGRRGICPHCGAKVQIPAESTLPASTADTARDENGPGDPPPSLSAPSEGGGDDSELPDTPVPSTDSGVAPPMGPKKPPPQSDAPSDPLEEAPDAAWYVRSPAGGQFGPANGQAMRQWIEEGRISGDSLVWREGWRDWQEASAVFAQVGSSGPIPRIDTGSSPLASRQSAAASSQAENGGDPRPASSRKPVLIVTILILAVVGLLVALVLVLLR